MLAKLLKHEFHATGKVLPISYLGMVLLFCLCWLMKTIAHGNTAAFLIPFILYAVSILFVLIMTYVVTIMRFFKSMYGNEAYLTHTLPATKQQLLTSRLIVFVVWMIAGSLMVFAGIIGVIFLACPDWTAFSIAMRTAFYALPSYSWIIPVSLVIGSLLMAFEVFFSISLANTAKFLKSNVAFSVVFFFVTMMAVQLIDSLAAMFVPLSLQINTVTGEAAFVTENMMAMFNQIIADPTAPVMNIGLFGFVIELLLIVVFYLLTRRLMEKKINIK